MYLDVKDGVIRDISFQGEGCAIAKASASMMTSVVKGKSLADASDTFKRFHQMITGGQDPRFDLEAMGKLAAFSGVSAFPVRVKCASLLHTECGHERKHPRQRGRPPQGSGKVTSYSQRAPDPTLGLHRRRPYTLTQLERLVWQELRECYDPEIPVNIVELGLVYAMRSEPLPEGGHRVEVRMTVTSLACGMSDSCARSRCAHSQVAGRAQVEVAITFDHRGCGSS